MISRDSYGRGLQEYRLARTFTVRVLNIFAALRCGGYSVFFTGKHIIVHKKKEPRKPQLADLPLIGRLFYSPPQVEETKNLLILVKPIINPPKKAPPEPLLSDPNDPLIKQLEEKFKRYDEQK